MSNKLSVFLFFLPIFLFAKISIYDGKDIAPILVPAEMSLVQQTALNELTHYLSEICNKSVQVIKETENYPKSAIYLGACNFTLKQSFGLEDFADEEWMIKTHKGNLFLAGGEPRGTLYAVYHFLEDVLALLSQFHVRFCRKQAQREFTS